MTKSISLRLSMLCLILFSFSAHAFCSNPSASKPVSPSDKLTMEIRAAELVKFTAADYAQMTGKKMTIRQKMGFAVLKIKLRKELKKNPDLLLSDFYKDKKKMATGWVVLLVVLSALCLLFLIFAIAYGGGFK